LTGSAPLRHCCAYCAALLMRPLLRAPVPRACCHCRCSLRGSAAACRFCVPAQDNGVLRTPSLPAYLPALRWAFLGRGLDAGTPAAAYDAITAPLCIAFYAGGVAVLDWHSIRGSPGRRWTCRRCGDAWWRLSAAFAHSVLPTTLIRFAERLRKPQVPLPRHIAVLVCRCTCPAANLLPARLVWLPDLQPPTYGGLSASSFGRVVLPSAHACTFPPARVTRLFYSHHHGAACLILLHIVL